MDYASFNHPVCCVPSHPNSREEILGIFQWYRILSPYLTIKVNSVGMYSRVLFLINNGVISDQSIVAAEQNTTLYLDITQTFHLWFSIFSPKPANLVTKLKLQSYDASWDPSVVSPYSTVGKTTVFTCVCVDRLCIALRRKKISTIPSSSSALSCSHPRSSPSG